MSERQPDRKLDWPGLLEAALTIEGSVGNSFNRLYRYSLGNLAFLMYQGVTPQPVATYKKWAELGRQVKRGSKAREIIRPITITLKDELDDQGQPKKITKFKPVRAIFPIEDTEGEPLPEIELAEWSRSRAMGALALTEVPFEMFDGGTAGYSFQRKIAVSPVAADPEATWFHEASHIIAGHTEPDTINQYKEHRGVFELEAEGSAYLVMNELELMTPEAATRSRGYIQGWMRGKTPPEQSVRTVFKTADKIIDAGRLTAESEAA
jgi:antirestriction protein ArdC